MWTREFIKTKAKDVLSFSYWKSFLVSIVIAIAGGAGGSSSGGSGGRSNGSYGSGNFISREAIYVFILILLGVMVLRILIGYMLEVGGRRYFIRAAKEDVQMGYLGYVFNKDRYFDVLATMLLRSIFLFLWTLLLIIPGIIKSYSYRFVPYILADNPNIGAKRAIELSNEMTSGEKWNIFVLDLSFLGWYLLGLIACCIGVLFVKPYEDATNAELYLLLRQDAIGSGLTTFEELLVNEEDRDLSYE